MNIKRISLIIILCVLILNGCENRSDVSDEKNNSQPGQVNETPINISIEEAEKIALEQASLENLDSPVIPDNWETIIQSVYSIKYDRDVLVYRVALKTAALPPEEIMFDAYYYISTDNGEVIVSNH